MEKKRKVSPETYKKNLENLKKARLAIARKVKNGTYVRRTNKQILQDKLDECNEKLTNTKVLLRKNKIPFRENVKKTTKTKMTRKDLKNLMQ